MDDLGATIDLPPNPAALLQSLRSFGYSPESAIADLIDNSIAAGASSVDVALEWNDGQPFALMLDDGHGMHANKLKEAMRLGGHGPGEIRSAGDLGRFGLGLKTASLSQCRRMTVVSRADGRTAALRWDIDEVIHHKRWIVAVPSTYPDVPLMLKLEKRKQGTLVLWEKIDAVSGLYRLDSASFYKYIRLIRQHLAMVFHRYLEQGPKQLRISINGRDIKPWDPFLRWHTATILLPAEPISYEGETVTAKAYVLPHRDRFDNETSYETAGGNGGWNKSQGFYVYRQERLLMAGGWLGLGRGRTWTRDETSRLARISIEFPPALDSHWRIDVTKSKARLPSLLHEEIASIAEHCRHEARNVFAWRGRSVRRQALKDNEQPVWLCPSNGISGRYRINRKHFGIAALIEMDVSDPSLVEAMLTLIENTVPVQRIWMNVTEAEGAPENPLTDQEANECAEKLATLARLFPAEFSAGERADMLLQYHTVSNSKLRAKLVNLLREEA